MAAVDFYKLKDKRDELLLAPLNFAVLLAPFGTEIPAKLTDEAGKFVQLPAGWFSVGEIQKAAGVNMAPEMSVTGPEGYGSKGRRRDLVESETFSIEFTAQETRLKTLDLAMDLDVSKFKAADKELRFDKRRALKLPEYSALFIGLDGEQGQELYPYFLYPKVTNTQRASLSLTDTNIIEYAVKLDYKETPGQAPWSFGLAGPGLPAFAAELEKANGVF